MPEMPLVLFVEEQQPVQRSVRRAATSQSPSTIAAPVADGSAVLPSPSAPQPIPCLLAGVDCGSSHEGVQNKTPFEREAA